MRYGNIFRHTNLGLNKSWDKIRADLQVFEALYSFECSAVGCGYRIYYYVATTKTSAISNMKMTIITCYNF